jgi:hypothetical protein
MPVRTPILTLRQLGLIERAAAALPVDRRADFVRDVRTRLTGEPADYAVVWP